MQDRVITHVALGDRPPVTAPDGSTIHELCRIDAASVSHCTLPPGTTTRAMRHRTVEEVWFVLSGRARLWQRDTAGREETIDLAPGSCVTIPLGHAFQFRTEGTEQLAMLLTTCPPWPGPDEAVAADGPWDVSLLE